MPKEKLIQNQTNLFENTTHGFMPAKEVRYFGSEISEKDQKHFKGQMDILLRDFVNRDFWNKQEWINNTGFFDADRLLRFIAEGKVPGFAREKKKFGNLHWKYRVIKT